MRFKVVKDVVKNASNNKRKNIPNSNYYSNYSKCHHHQHHRQCQSQNPKLLLRHQQQAETLKQQIRFVSTVHHDVTHQTNCNNEKQHDNDVLNSHNDGNNDSNNDSNDRMNAPQSHFQSQIIQPQPNPFTEASIELIKEIADDIRTSVRSYTSNHNLKLIGITTSRSYLQSYQKPLQKNKIHKNKKNNDPPIKLFLNEGIESYSDSISKTFAEDGIHYELWRVAGGYNMLYQLDHLIKRANSMQDVHGVLMYYPLFRTSYRPYILGCGDDDFNNNDGGDGDGDHDDLEKILERNRRGLPGLTYKTRDDYYRSSIDYKRDVEGLCSYYHSRKIFKNPHLYVDKNMEHYINGGDGDDSDHMVFPCTALAVVRILKQLLIPSSSFIDPTTEKLGKRFEGVTVTIINRSEILGRPLASMLANDGATVYSVDKDSILLYSYKKMRRLNTNHPHTQRTTTATGGGRTSLSSSNDVSSIQSCITKSNVVITAVPSSTFKIPTDWIQPNSYVINVASEPNIDEEELSLVPGVTYVPQIGKVTVALLEYNLVLLHRRYHCQQGL